MGRRVHVSDEVERVWHSHRQTAPDTAESFGVLMGTTSFDRREIWIETITTPMEHDRRTRFSFALRDPGHQQAVCGMFACSGGRTIYLGTWHTHPEPVAETVVDRPERLARVPLGEPRTPAGFCARRDGQCPCIRAGKMAIQAVE